MALRTCIVSYWHNNVQQKCEVTAESVYEAVALGIKAMEVDQSALHLLSFDIRIEQPHAWKSVTGQSLRAWLAMPGKSRKEQALKTRLGEMMREKN